MGRAGLTNIEEGRSIYVVRGKVEHLLSYATDPLPVFLVRHFLNLVQNPLNQPLDTFGRHTDTPASSLMNPSVTKHTSVVN